MFAGETGWPLLDQPVRWEWGNQGRSQYTHDFNNFSGIARGLFLHRGANVAGAEDTLKNDLRLATGLPFPPAEYTAWRNYSAFSGLSYWPPLTLGERYKSPTRASDWPTRGKTRGLLTISWSS